MARPPVPESTRRQLDGAVGRLRKLLPAGWQLNVTGRSVTGGRLRISSEQAEGDLWIWTRKRVEPRDVPGLPEREGPTIVASRWLSPRTRELLRATDIGYLDDTGNASIGLTTPGLYIRTDGADRDPTPRPTKGPNLRGPRAWALLRTLIEVAPPYGVRDLSAALQVDAGYVSRLLQVLERELLIERRPRGPVTSVDWEGTLRQVVSTYSLFDANEASTWIAPGGAEQLIRDLANKRAGQWAVTGSFASAGIVSVAAPETAFIYTTDPDRIAKIGRLLPATTGTNVVLAVPYDEIVFTRMRRSANVNFVSTAQTAVDDLTGPGRMPQEGEAVIAWMKRNLKQWQATSLTTPTDNTS
jgi:hypothetical protein